MDRLFFHMLRDFVAFHCLMGTLGRGIHNSDVFLNFDGAISRRE